MLILSRKAGEQIVIGDSITVEVVSVSSDSVILRVLEPPGVVAVPGPAAPPTYCPRCRIPVTATPKGTDIEYSCTTCDWGITQPAAGDPDALREDRNRRTGRHEQMRDSTHYEPRRRYES